MRGAGTRSEDVRRSNLARLLRYVHEHGPTPRSRLTSVLGLNRSTIGDLTRELVDGGLLQEEAGRAPDDSRGAAGRPSYVVSPDETRVRVLAVDVGVTHLTVAVVGLGGVVLDRRDHSYRRGARHPNRVADAIVRDAAALTEDAATPLAGVGVAVPGMVRLTDGLVAQAPNLGWLDVPFGSLLGERLGLAVQVANDADLGMRAEHVRGAARETNDAVYLAGHSGVGAGILAGGSPLGGRAGYAGEVGHSTINAGGRSCHCGSVGCWETECGEERLFQLAGRPAGGGLSGVREVVAAAQAGEEAAGRAVHHVATWLGRGTVNVVNVLNPQVVIMGGALEQILLVAGDTVLSELRRTGLPLLVDEVRLVRPYLGQDSTLLGAAELAFDPLLTDPLQHLADRVPA